MTFNLKQILSVGLGLGVATALGYHVLYTPADDSDQPERSYVLRKYELAATPDTQPVMPPADELSYPQALPLPSDPAVATGDVQADNQFTDIQQLEPGEGYTLGSQTAFEVDSEPFSLQLDDPVDETNAPTAEHVQPSDDEEFDFGSVESEPQISLLPSASDRNPADMLTVPSFESDMNPPTAAPALPQINHMGSATKKSAAQIDQTASAAGSSTIQRTWQTNPFAKNKEKKRQSSTAARQPATPPSQPDEPSFDAGSTIVSLNESRLEMTAAADSAAPVSVLGTPTDLQNNTVDNRVADNRQPSTLPAPAAGPVLVNVPLSESDAVRAVERIEYGKTLARRGAAYSARQEFLAAMQIMAEGNDRATGTSEFSLALKEAVLAIEEAADFSVDNPEQQIHMDVAAVVETHRSRVVSRAEATRLSPQNVMNRYFAFAQSRLDLAGGRNVVAAEAYFCMGKLNTLLNRKEKVLGPYVTAKSVVYHQAALLSDNRHHRSANELGVLLAKNGRLEQAKSMFEQSLLIQPAARTWQNLAQAHHRLGEAEFANQANNELRLLASQQLSTNHATVLWKPVKQFNADAPALLTEPTRVASRPADQTNNGPAGKNDTTPRKTITQRLKDLF